MGDLFGVSQPTVSRVYRSILPLIGEALCLHVPGLKEVLRSRLVLVDGTEVPTGNRAGHKDNYSGKRRRAGLNIQVAADINAGLLGISAIMHGSMHDRKAFTECDWEDLLADTPTIADPAYQGTHLITPRKKPKGGELSASDKENNKITSSIRSGVYLQSSFLVSAGGNPGRNLRCLSLLVALVPVALLVSRILDLLPCRCSCLGRSAESCECTYRRNPGRHVSPVDDHEGDLTDSGKAELSNP
ncbi:transposase family protein [Saccharopolyspora sp. NPDC000995]